ncbi:MAG: type II toxin-antitoxin system prevent-host-death family antitoxin [Chloroflexi bacterium]|nr:type II toxin-antitoxin system prevent-host-death family antitoxin [Chloroflexota bacterium]
MTTERTETRAAWTVAEAKARLSEILRLAEEEGPQRIGVRNSFVVVPESLWQEREPEPELTLGQWLVRNMPRGTNLEIPDRHADRDREIPFADWRDVDWGDE